MLHEAAASTLSEDAGVVGALDVDAALSVKATMDVHAATVVVEVAALAVGAGADDLATGCANFTGTCGRGAAVEAGGFDCATSGWRVAAG
jgi:hypothetical protein